MPSPSPPTGELTIPGGLQMALFPHQHPESFLATTEEHEKPVCPTDSTSDRGFLPDLMPEAFFRKNIVMGNSPQSQQPVELQRCVVLIRPSHHQKHFNSSFSPSLQDQADAQAIEAASGKGWLQRAFSLRLQQALGRNLQV